MQSMVHLSKSGGVDKALIKEIADSLASEMAEKMYYKLMLLKFLPEIDAVRKGKAKALKGKEIDAFFKRALGS